MAKPEAQPPVKVDAAVAKLRIFRGQSTTAEELSSQATEAVCVHSDEAQIALETQLFEAMQTFFERRD